jgi:hypothetical protein
LAAPHDEGSRPIYEAPGLPFGFHAVSLVRRTGRVVCDSLEIIP